MTQKIIRNELIRCKTTINGSRIDVECFNTEGEKSVILEIFDMDSNFRLVDYKFNLYEYTNIWNVLTYNPFHFEFVNGFKIRLTNTKTNNIEFEDILLINSYSKTKFIDKDNILPHDIIQALNHNYIESFEKFKNDSLDIKNDKIIVDLGSSVGLFTAYALEQNPNIKSICVEMNPNFHKMCVDTFKDNSNIIPINAAIHKTSNEVIELKSIRQDLNDLGNTVVENLFSDQTYVFKINTISIEDILIKFNIDRISLLKVDIEGYEYELFENLSDDILDKIDKIFLEFHKVDDNHKKLNLINRLMINNFKMRSYDGDIDFYNTYMFSLLFTKK